MEAAVLVCMTALGTFYFVKKRDKKNKALVCKAAATFLPLFLMLRNCEPAAVKTWPFWCTALGIVLYMAADVLLECRFIPGAVCFAAGHICMGTGFAADIAAGQKNCGSITGLEYPAGAAVCAGISALLFTGAAYAVLHRYFPYLKKKKVLFPAVLYIVILSITAALAVTETVLCADGRGRWAPAAGGCAFVLSDILLGKNRFGPRRSPVRGAFVLILYYLAVYLFAMRLWV